MTLRSRLGRIERDMHKDMVVVKLKDGTTRAFADPYVFKEMFLCQYELLQGQACPSEVLDTVREATLESRDSFEAEYGSIEMEANIIAPVSDGGWVETHRLLEDGTVESVRHEGGTEEAERIRRGARERGSGFSFLWHSHEDEHRGQMPAWQMRPPTPPVGLVGKTGALSPLSA